MSNPSNPETEALFSITEFSRICGLSRKALIYYDTIGLFSPAMRSDNGYRWYLHNQIETIYMIQAMSASGFSLSQIKAYRDQYDPGKARSVFAEQKEKLKAQIRSLQACVDLIDKRIADLEEVERTGEKTDADKTVHIEEQPPRPIYLSARFHEPTLNIPAQIWLDFYATFESAGLAYGYPASYVVAKEDVKNGNWSMISQLAVMQAEGSQSETCTPAGLYATACGTGHYGQTEEIYRRILRETDRLGYEIRGDAYEEYLADEVVQTERENYLIRVSIPVGKKNADA